MNTGKTIFAQLMDFVTPYEFRKCVERYDGNRKVISFSCWDQYLCMAFAQLTYRESLRDIQVCLRAAQSKLYHLGIRGKVSRNTLAHANQKRDWRIYADFAHGLIAKARRLYARDSFGVELDQTVYALDSTTINLCLALFPWAGFRKHKGAVKLHTLLDLRGNIPTVAIITTGKVHDVNILDDLRFEAGSIYIMDRGYLDYGRLYAIHQNLGFFVTPAKKNFGGRRLYSRPVDKSTGVQCDQTVTLKGFYAKQDYPEKLRRIRYFDSKSNKRLVFLTNNFSLPPAGDDRRTLSQSLAGGAVFQVDQAASPDQGILWHHRKRRQDPDMDRHLRLCSGGDREKDLESGPQSLHNSTGFERDSFRENAYFTSTYEYVLRKQGGSPQQPVKFIRLTLGQQ